MADANEKVREILKESNLEAADLDGVEMPPSEGPSDDERSSDAPSPDDLSPNARSAQLPLNDFGNGRRLVEHFGQDIRHVQRVGWFVWNGRVWAKDPDAIAVRARAQQLGDIVQAEIEHLTLSDQEMRRLAQKDRLEAELLALGDQEGGLVRVAGGRAAEIEAELSAIERLKGLLMQRKKEHRAWARASGNSTRMSAALNEAQVLRACRFDELDAGALDVNTRSGVLRFSVDGGPGTGFSRTARFDLVPHEREQLLTKMMPVDYDPSAKAPLFAAALERSQPVPEVRDFVQRWFGYSMTALVSEQKLAFFHGSGANGKTVLVDLMARIFGDYAATAKIESLVGQNRRSGADATPDLVPLMGARMVRASEPEQGQRLQEGKIKELTGGEPILVRALNEDFVEVQPRFKLTISGNHKPEIRGTDDGIWRRVLLVPFDVQIPKEERDPLLVEKLAQEGPGILNWLIEGLLAYLEDGLQEPAAVLAATADYRAESDPMGAFLTDRCQVTGRPEDWLSTADLVAGFNFHCALEGVSGWKERTIALALRTKAEQWRHPRDGLTFRPQKRSVSGYGGIRWTDFFAKTLRDAPKDQHGRPMPPKSAPDETQEPF